MCLVYSFYILKSKKTSLENALMAKSLNTTVTSKGQITIPREIRDKMQLASGSKLEFLYKDDYIVMLPTNKSLKKLKGILPKPEKTLSCEEINEIVRNR